MIQESPLLLIFFCKHVLQINFVRAFVVSRFNFTSDNQMLSLVFLGDMDTIMNFKENNFILLHYTAISRLFQIEFA